MTVAKIFYARMLTLLECLIEIDPPAKSDEGLLLRALSSAIEDYERVKFPELSNAKGKKCRSPGKKKT